jgi:hypothetical protein
MASLDEDLQRYSEEFSKGDLKAGFKLVGEITGAVGLVTAAIVVITYGVPFLNTLGFPITVGAAMALIKQAAKVYPHLDEKERKEIRAVASFVKGGFNLSRFI